MPDDPDVPRVEMVTEFKCIEGWSQILYWAGARFVDFAVKYGPATLSGDPPDPIGRPEDLVGYVSMETPGGDYYVGLDMESVVTLRSLKEALKHCMRSMGLRVARPPAGAAKSG